MGVSLFDKDRMKEIWRTQQHHIDCIQDPPGVQLYRKIGKVTKRGGGVHVSTLCTWLNVLGVLQPAPKPLCARYAFFLNNVVVHVFSMVLTSVFTVYGYYNRNLQKVSLKMAMIVHLV